MRYTGQTGGAKKTWLFDPSTAENIGAIRDALVHNDEYFFEDDGTTTLAIVMDRILDDLPEDIGRPFGLFILKVGVSVPLVGYSGWTTRLSSRG